ncbi:MAG: UDP-N-acetylmuramoyl-L-alanine--D-glutamate ligase [Ruminococcaceae bacterium]|nr:UDP-N-acetylmuramoyl-L-alanine--D-glutamate ligase [Oscillospiraceae bacterium]
MDNRIFNFLTSLKGKKISLIGIGRSNLPLIKLFSSYGAQVTACDRRSYEELGEFAELAQESGATLSLGEGYLENLDADIVLRTPGMRYYLDNLVEMRKNGVVVTSEMELFFDLCPCKIIGVTGSDGKTTTTTIISELLKKAGYKVHLGGNIGKPLLPKIESIDVDDIAVVELSSFQLISMRKSPDVSIVTNIEPNHLDIHKDMQEYVDSKKNVVIHQNAFSKTVLNLDNELSNSFSDDVRGELRKFSRTAPVFNGCYLCGEDIFYSEFGEKVKVLSKSDIKIPGMHNVENFMTAISAVWGLVSIDAIVDVAKSFGGVEHRAEFVRELNGVRYYNDSIASSPTRTACGTLSLYDEKILLICGGYDKNLDYTDLGGIICEKVKHLILLGATADKIENAVKNCFAFCDCGINIIRVNSMEDAVNKARELAVCGDVVSMSPASASFDMYKNFEERGNHFKMLVNELV